MQSQVAFVFFDLKQTIPTNQRAFPRIIERWHLCSMPRILDIPVNQALAVAKLLECVNGKSMRVSSFPLESDQQKMELVLALHDWGALRTLPDNQKQPKRRLEKQKGQWPPP